MPKVPPEHSDQRRAQILDAAFLCFSEKGFHQTTMREIFEQAGLSAGAVYSYFKSKDEILEALVEWGRRLSKEQFATLTPPVDWGELFVRSVQSLGNPLSKQANRLDMHVWAEALSTPRLAELFNQRLHEIIGQVADLVEQSGKGVEGQESGTAERNRAEALARLGIALILGMSIQNALDPSLDLEQTAEALARLFSGNDGRASQSLQEGRETKCR